MGQLTYTVLSSLDLYVNDRSGRFDWAMPDEQVHRHANAVQAEAGTYLYGRRMYEVMTAWETDPALARDSPVSAEFAATWADADKIVYSTTLDAPITSRTRVERSLDLDAVAALVAGSERDVAVSGSVLAAELLRAGLVQEFRCYLFPVVVGGGTPALPDDVDLDLELAELQRFGQGTVYLRYLIRG